MSQSVLSASMSETKTEIWTVTIQDQDLKNPRTRLRPRPHFQQKPSRGRTSFCHIEIFHFLSQSFWGLGGLNRLLWARPRPWEHKTKTETTISRHKTETRPRPAKASTLETGLETRPSLETSITGHNINSQATEVMRKNCCNSFS